MSDDLDNITVKLPWTVSDYLDMYGYNGNKFTGIIDRDRRIIVGYDGKLTLTEAAKLVKLANENSSIAMFIMKEKLTNGTNPDILHRILEKKA